MKKRTIIILCVFAVLIAGVLTWHHIAEQNRQREAEIREKYHQLHRSLIIQRLLMLDSNQPERHFVWSDRRFFTVGDNSLQRITSVVETSTIVFVYSEEEGRAFPNDVIVVWPSSFTQPSLDTINSVIERFAARDDISDQQAMAIEAFNEDFGGLLTIEHVIEDPLMVWELYMSLGSRIRYTISTELGR
jgi:hypothetical protein